LSAVGQADAVLDQKADHADDLGRPAVAHRSGDTGQRRKRRDDADPALALAQHEPDAERRDQAAAEEEAEVFLEPPRQRQHDRRAGVEPPAEILEHRLELRHDIDEEEQQDEDRRGDQENLTQPASSICHVEPRTRRTASSSITTMGREVRSTCTTGSSIAFSIFGQRLTANP